MPPLAFDGDRGRGQKGTPNELRQGDCQAMDHNGSFGICLQGLHRPGQVVRFSAHDLAIHSAWVAWRKPGSCPVLGAICHYHEPTPFREYGPDGYPKTDTDYDHDHGQGKPHCHDVGRPSDGSPPTHNDRAPGRPPTPSDPTHPNG